PGPINNLATLSMPGSTSSPWSFDFPVPSSGGSYEVYANAVSALGPSDLVGAEVNFAVTYATNGPHFEASATYVAPGGTLTLNGGGFGKSVAVHVTLDDRLLTTITSSSTGQLPPTTVTIPSNASFGLSTLVATNLEGQNSTFAITIANSWDQLGYGPGRIASEPNDLVYNYLIFPGGNNWEKLAWHFEPGSGAAFNSSPVVVNGVAYVGDSLGQLFALDIHNGGLIWTYTLASGAAIDGTPAVDAQLGLVFFGASDGTLDAVHVSTGNLAWSDSIGGNVRAPAFSGGEIYVTSSSGAVEAIVESTGAVTWTHPLSAMGGAAAVDLTGNFVAVGEAGGDVLGLNAATGATLWTYATGGSISSTPVVSTGRVFVGSSNDRVSALSETTGKLDWSFTTSGAVEDSGSISGNRSGGVTALFIGSEGGYLYGLNAATGRLDLNVKVGSPVMGVSTANGIAVIETAKGGISATRTWVSQLDWTYSTAATLTTTPVLEDGSIYVSGTDGNVYAFSTEGQPPV
ncbi:MAG: PQQ-binding-like beta-propeller repeat protein, partial [Thermoplasmata archaeon]